MENKTIAKEEKNQDLKLEKEPKQEKEEIIKQDS
jgi:hypothetical protein